MAGWREEEAKRQTDLSVLSEAAADEMVNRCEKVELLLDKVKKETNGRDTTVMDYGLRRKDYYSLAGQGKVVNKHVRIDWVKWIISMRTFRSVW